MKSNNKHSKLSRVNKQKKRNIILKIILIIITVIFFSIAIFTGYASWKIDQILHQTSDPSDKIIGKDNEEEKNKEYKLEDKPFALLVIGEDYRAETGSRNTDAIIVSIWNPTTKQVTLLSIPRDTKVTVPGYGDVKINSVYAKGEIEKRQQEQSGQTSSTSGAQLLMEVVSDFLDIPVNNYVKVDFQGFVAIVNELGGLIIDVERDMKYYSEADGTNINLRQGVQLLNGKKALDYARFRISFDGNDASDFERNERHQKLIKAVVDKLVSFSGISNIFDILDIAGEHLKTNLTPDEMKGIFIKYKGVKKDNLISHKMESYWQSPYVYVNNDELIRIQNELKKAFE